MKKLIFVLLVTLSKGALVPHKIRNCLLRLAGIKIGKKTVICNGVEFRSPNVKIGNNVLINRNCHIYSAVENDEKYAIEIGDNVKISFDVKMITSRHVIGDADLRCGENITQGIKIHDGSWLGVGCTIFPGVDIGYGCVIGGGALVNKDCESNAVYVGVPAKMIRKLDEHQ